MAGALLTGSGDTSSATAASGTSITVPRPTSTVAGDRLVAVVHGRNNSGPYTAPPSGWVLLGHPAETTVGWIGVYVHEVPSGGPAASWVWAGGSGRHTAVVARSRDLAPISSLVDVVGAYTTLIQASTDPRVVLSEVVTSESHTLLLAVASINTTDASPTRLVPPAEMTTVGSVNTATGASDTGLTVAQALQVPSGATGTRTLRPPANTPAGSVGSGMGWLLALKTVNKPSIADTTAPTISIAEPASGQVVAGTVTISGLVADDVGVDYVDVTVGGVALGRATIAGSTWTRSWDTTARGNGTVTISATARDTAGNTASATRSTTVANGSAGGSLTPLALAPRDRPRDLAQMDADLDVVLAWLDANGL